MIKVQAPFYSPSVYMAAFCPPTKEEYEKSDAWGLLTSIDIHDCNPDTIRDEVKVKEHVHKLCDMLGVKRFGPTEVIHFADHNPRVAGFSMTQLIETSLVSAHYANESNSVYLDIFSCCYYDPQQVLDFSAEFFEAKYSNAHSILRGCMNHLPQEYLEKIAQRNIVLQSKNSEETPMQV